MRVLLIEDEPTTAKAIELMLTTEGFNVYTTDLGEEGLDLGKLYDYDIICLDLNLPDMHGYEVLKKLRAARVQTPVLILSGISEMDSKVRSFGFGADDYVTKPFGMRELAARMRVALRHKLQQQGEKPIFQSGGLSVDLVRRIVKVDGNDIKLSPKEYDILRLLVQHAGKVLTHQFILNHVWGPAADVQYLRIYVRQLRQKIEALPDQPQYILTETGVGYRLREADAL